MDYLKLRVTKAILEKIAANEGKLSWYNIVVSIDCSGKFDTIPPPFYVLKELVNLELIEIVPSNTENRNADKYKLTKAGRDFLNS